MQLVQVVWTPDAYFRIVLDVVYRLTQSGFQTVACVMLYAWLDAFPYLPESALFSSRFHGEVLQAVLQ